MVFVNKTDCNLKSWNDLFIYFCTFKYKRNEPAREIMDLSHRRPAKAQASVA